MQCEGAGMMKAVQCEGGVYLMQWGWGWHRFLAGQGLCE